MEHTEEPSKIHSRKFALDLGMVLSLLVWFAIPLILFRGSPMLADWPWRIGFVVGTGVLLALWRRIGRQDAAPSVAGPALWPAQLWVVVLTLLAGLTYVAFFVPLTIHFWGGGDDLQVLMSQLWHPGFDHGLSRPLNLSFMWLGLQLTPGRVEGQLFIASLLCLANAVFLMGVVRELLPNHRLLALAAAVMFILNRGDLSRFMIMWTTSLYWGPLCFLLLGSWLWLVSSRLRSRMLLFAACFCLGVALLGTEGLFPLAGTLCVLVYRYWQDRRHGFTWLAAWLGTVALFTVRFLQFLLSKGQGSYQFKQTQGSHGQVNIWHAIEAHFTAFLKYLDLRGAAWEYWPAGVGVFVMVLLLCWFFRRPASGTASPSLRPLVYAVGGGIVAMTIGFLAFLHIPHLFRTHFLASAGESVAVAAVLCLAGSLLPVRWRALGTGLLLAVVAGLSCVVTYSGQKFEKRFSPITFEKLVYMFEQVHTLAPAFAPDTALLYVLDDGIVAPTGGASHMNRITKLVLGQPSYIINGSTTDATARLGPKGIIPTQPETTGPQEYGYEKLVAFRLSQDGTTRLLPEFPPALAAEAPEAARLYRPLARMRAGEITPINFVRLPYWSEVTADLFDFTPGVALGQNWGEKRVSSKDRLFREFYKEADIWVNPAGRSSIEIPLNIKPDSDDVKGDVEFNIRNDQGTTVLQTRLPKDGRMKLKLPLVPDRVQRFRLDFSAADADGKSPPLLKAYRPGTVQRLPAGRRRSDITDAGTVLGENWHPLERYDGLTFRWVSNDAEIKPGVWTSGAVALSLAVEGGPGLGDQGGTLQVRTQDGLVLASTPIRTFAEINVKLPRPLLANEALYLHVEGGGRPSPRGDPRILNFRVFQCSLKPPTL